MRIDLKLAAIIAIALILRTYGLSSVPMWDWDEGANINYAANLMDGKAMLFAYKYHFIPHPPLYFMALAAWFKLFGATMYAIRSFSVLCSIASLIVVYKLVEESLDEDSAALAALLFAVWPEMIYWGRMGFANNLLGLLALTSIYFLQRFIDRGGKHDLLLASLAVGLCPITEYTGSVFIIVFGLLLNWHAGKQYTKAMATTLAPSILFAAYMVAFDLDGFMKEAGNNIGLYPLAVPAVIAFIFAFGRFSRWIHGYLKENAYITGGKDPSELIVLVGVTAMAVIPPTPLSIVAGTMPVTVITLALIGLLLIGKESLRNVLFTYAVGYGLIMVALGRWDHMSIPLLYILSCSPIFFIHRVRGYIRDRMPKWATLFVVLPFALLFWNDIGGFVLGGICATPVAELAGLNGFINQRASETDITVTFSYLAPGLETRTAVLLDNVLPYNGYRVSYVNRDYGKDEFIYNLSTDNIRFMVVPDGLVGELANVGDGNLSERFGDWNPVYRVQSTQSNGECLGRRLQELAKAAVSCEHDYVVLENPAMGGAPTST